MIIGAKPDVPLPPLIAGGTELALVIAEAKQQRIMEDGYPCCAHCEHPGPYVHTVPCLVWGCAHEC